MLPGDSLPTQTQAVDSAAPPNRRETGSTRGIAVAVLLLLGVCVWGVYGRSIHAPFIFDDYNSVLANASITRLWPLVGDATARGPLNPPPQFCTAGRPLVNLTLALNYRFGGFDPSGYHVVDILIHILSAALVWGIVRRTLELPFFADRFAGASAVLALGVALVWALHPLQSEAVIYITQRTELLVSFCYLATLYASLRYSQADAPRSRALWLGIATFACAAGMASKEIMVSAPVIVLAYERTFLTGSFRQSLRHSWPLYLGLAVTWLLLAVLNVWGPRSESTGFAQGIPAYVWWFTQAKVLLLYLKLSFWPWPLVIHYEYEYLDSLAAAWPWLLPALLLVFASAVMFLRRTAAGFVCVFLFAILSPTLLVPIVTEVAAERRMYLPLVALVALVVVGVYAALQAIAARFSTADGTTRHGGWPLLFTIVSCAGIAALSAAVCAQRAALYNDPLALWQDALAHQPNSASIRINLGMALTQAGRLDKAIPEFEEALRLKPDAADAANDLGMVLISAGQPAAALRPLELALASQPNFAEAHNNLGIALGQLGREQDALAHWRSAVALNPDYVEALMNLGQALARRGESAEAAERLEHALRLRPDLLAGYQPLVAAYLELNEPQKAIDTTQQALRIARLKGDDPLVERLSQWLADHGIVPN